jgi:hypothetical protein
MYMWGPVAVLAAIPDFADLISGANWCAWSQVVKRAAAQVPIKGEKCVAFVGRMFQYNRWTTVTGLSVLSECVHTTLQGGVYRSSRFTEQVDTQMNRPAFGQFIGRYL